jgi:hypothetical protein
MILQAAKRTLAIAVHDGLHWHACKMKRRGGEWVCVDRMDEPARAARQLPKELRDFIARSRARRLRIVIPGDVHTLSTELPLDASNEELQSALAYEAQGELGIEAAAHRLAAARSNLYDMGGSRGSFLAAAFEIEILERLADGGETDGVHFEGAASLELGLLTAHARRHPDQRLLFIRSRSSFYAVPARDTQPFMATMLPLGLDLTDSPSAHERIARAAERIALHDAVPLRVILPTADEAARARLASVIGNCREVEFIALEDTLAELLTICAATRVGGVDQSCPMIGLPPPPRDPHRHGTVIMFLILAASLLWLGLRHGELKREIALKTADLAAWESLERARRQAESESAALRERQQSLLARQTLLRDRRPLPTGLLPVLRTLGENMPPYSCLSKVEISTEAGISIEGLTHWQEGLTRLDAALRDTAASTGLQREFGGIETRAGDYAQTFSYRLADGEVAR